MSAVVGAARRWSPPPLIEDPWLRRAIYTGAAVYLVLAFASVPVNWTRIVDGLDRGWAFLRAFAPPDFVSRREEIWEGLAESLVMTVTSTVIGIALSIPFGVGAARNLAPLPVYLVCRAIIAG